LVGFDRDRLVVALRGGAVIGGHNSLFSGCGTYGNMKLFSIL
jgi:hypothetical protein